MTTDIRSAAGAQTRKCVRPLPTGSAPTARRRAKFLDNARVVVDWGIAESVMSTPSFCAGLVPRWLGSAARRLEHAADLTSEILWREWLLEKRRAGRQIAMHHCMIRVPGDEQHLHIRPGVSEACREVTPAHMRHDDVSDHQVDRVLMPFGDAKRIETVARFEHDVP